MRVVKENIFGGLVRSPPTTVEGFITEATNIKRALKARAAHYHRGPVVAAFSPSGCNNTDIREIIRDVVREEIKKFLPATARPASPSIAEIVREEVQQALQPEVLVSTAPEPPTLSYAAVVRRPPPPPRTFVAPPRRRSPAPQHDRRHDVPVQYVCPEPRAPGRPTCGERPTDALCASIAGKQTIPTTDDHTDDSGYAGSTRTTRAPVTVNAPAR